VKAGLPLSAMNIYDGPRQLARISFDDLDSPFPYLLCLPQSETERLLEEALGELGVFVERSAELIDFAEENGELRAVINREGELEELIARWLIGCDGAHSVVRHRLGLSFEGKQLAAVFWLADLAVRGDLNLREGYLFNSDYGLVALFPMDLGRARVILNRVDATNDLTFEQVNEIAQQRLPVELEFSDPNWIASFKIHTRRVDKYRVGNVFLAGDCAHIHSPAGGQGMNTGIQDAANLGWKLALVHKGLAEERLLDSYQIERLPVAARVLRETDLVTRMQISKNPAMRAARDSLFAAAASLTTFQHRAQSIISQLAVGYRKSPIVGEIWRPSARLFAFANAKPRPGDRAPESPLEAISTGTSTSIYSLLQRGKHLLIVFKKSLSPSSNWEQLSKKHAEILDLALIYSDQEDPAAGFMDKERKARTRYLVSGESAFLIRPDAYIAFRGDQPSDFDRYLSELFAAEKTPV